MSFVPRYSAPLARMDQEAAAENPVRQCRATAENRVYPSVSLRRYTDVALFPLHHALTLCI